MRLGSTKIVIELSSAQTMVFSDCYKDVYLGYDDKMAQRCAIIHVQTIYLSSNLPLSI